MEAKGFDVSEVSDDTMERLASKMADDYLEQMYWLSMEIIAEEMLDIPKIVFDREGNHLHIGDKVIWYDPEEEARDLSRIWTIDDVSPDIVNISDEYSEAEVLPNELKRI